MEELKELANSSFLSPHKLTFFLDGLKLKAFMLYIHRLSCFDFTDISSAVVFRPGTLQAEDELPIKFAWHMDFIAKPSMQLTPSTTGISNLYTPYLSVVLLTSKLISSAVLGEFPLNLHFIRTSTPDQLNTSN